jgi:HTH-type transcriptional regulator/antitoxin HigA
MKEIEPIRNETDYDAALARISELMDALSGPHGQVTDANHPHRVELDLLVSQVECYEDEHYPIDPPSAIEAIEFSTDQTGKSPNEPVVLTRRRD